MMPGMHQNDVIVFIGVRGGMTELEARLEILKIAAALAVWLACLNRASAHAGRSSFGC